MRIDCLTFLDPAVYRGGGEMVSARLLEIGRARGHDIRVSSVRPRRRELHDHPDFVLLIDVFNHAHSYRSLGAWRTFGEHFVQGAIARAPFVHLANAYADVCNLPYLPCSGHSAPKCPFKPLPRLADQMLLRDFGHACFSMRPVIRHLYVESALNVFVSPLHRKVCERVLGLDGARPNLVLKPMIDVELFHNEGGERDIDYLFVGVICEAKGLEEMRSRYRDTDIHLIGRVPRGTKLDFGRHLDHLPYAEIPRWMNRARNFVFLPRWPEPQGRVVAEAALCGCNIIGNDNVGALSFDFDLADPKNYGGAEEEFWQAVEAVA